MSETEEDTETGRFRNAGTGVLRNTKRIEGGKRVKGKATAV